MSSTYGKTIKVQHCTSIHKLTMFIETTKHFHQTGSSSAALVKDMHPQKTTRRSTIHRTAIVDFKIISDYHYEEKITNWQIQFLYIHRKQSTKFTLQLAMKAQSGVVAQNPAPAT